MQAPVVTPVATIALDKESLTLAPAGSQQLSATVKDAAGNVLTGRAITWTSNAASVATVSGTGLVTAVASGSAVVTVVSEGKAAAATVIVQKTTTVTPAGGTVTSADGRVTLVIPAGALAAPTTISIEPAGGTPAAPRGVANAQYAVSPAGTVLAQPAMLKMAYDATAVPNTTSQEALRLHTVAQGQWARVGGSTVDSVAHVVRGTINSLGTYGVIGAGMLFYEYAAGGRGPERESVTVCQGGTLTLEPRQMGALAGAASTATSLSDSGAVSAAVTFGTLYIDGRAAGTSVVTVRTYGELNPLTVTVISDPARCRRVALGLSINTNDSLDVYLLENGSLSRLTSTSYSSFVSLGLYGGSTGPIAFLSPNSPGTLRIYWNGTSGTSSQTVLPPANARFWGGAFLDGDTYVLPQVAPSGFSDMYAVTRNGSPLIRLTDFKLVVFQWLTAGGRGGLFFDGFTAPQYNAYHVFKLPSLSVDGPVATGPAVPLTTTFREQEFQPGVSADERFVALVQASFDFPNRRIMLRDMTDVATAPLFAVSPATGYTYTPTWCGSNIYYSYNTVDSGPFVVYKWNIITKTSTSFAPLAGLNVLQMSAAHTTLDGMFVCP
jgi:hypothetical protein